MSNTANSVDYGRIIQMLESELINQQEYAKILQKEITSLNNKLKSTIIDPEFIGDKKIQKEKQLCETISGYNEMIALIETNATLLDEYKKRKSGWDKTVSEAFKEAVDGGFDNLINRARKINDPKMKQRLKDFESVVKNGGANKEQKATAYLAFRNEVCIYEKQQK